MNQQFSTNNQDTVGQYQKDLKFDTPKKGKLRIMPVSYSSWAPTGFGTNTKNIACILYNDGHHIAYGGCQNPHHQNREPQPLDNKVRVYQIHQQPHQILHLFLKILLSLYTPRSWWCIFIHIR